MAWTQLYGKLQYFERRGSYVSKFLAGIIERAPRPWFKPFYGAILPPLRAREEFDVEGDVLGMAKNRNQLTILLRDEGDELCIKRFDLLDGTEHSSRMLWPGPWKCGKLKMDGLGRNVYVGNEKGVIVHYELKNIDGNSNRIKEDTRSQKKAPGMIWDVKLLYEYAESNISSRGQCIAVSSIGNLLVVGTSDGTIRVWEYADGEWWRTKDLKNQKGEIQSVYVSNTGTRIISTETSGRIFVWKRIKKGWTGKEVSGFQWDHPSKLENAVISDDGNCVVLSHFNEVIVFREVDNSWVSLVFRGHTDVINSVAISSDGTKIASGSSDGTVRVWTKYGNNWGVEVFSGCSGAVLHVSISSDGGQVFSFSKKHKIHVWQQRWDIFTHHLQSVKHPVRRLSLSGDGSHILGILARSNNLVMWRKIEGNWISQAIELPYRLFGQFGMNGTRVMTAGNKLAIRVLHDPTWYIIGSHESFLRFAVITEEGNRIFSVSEDDTYCVWTRHNMVWIHQVLPGSRGDVVNHTANVLRPPYLVGETRAPTWNCVRFCRFSENGKVFCVEYFSETQEKLFFHWIETSPGVWQSFTDFSSPFASSSSMQVSTPEENTAIMRRFRAFAEDCFNNELELTYCLSEVLYVATMKSHPFIAFFRLLA